jgi:hypothetical protein
LRIGFVENDVIFSKAIVKVRQPHNNSFFAFLTCSGQLHQLFLPPKWIAYWEGCDEPLPSDREHRLTSENVARRSGYPARVVLRSALMTFLGLPSSVLLLRPGNPQNLALDYDPQINNVDIRVNSLHF